jgi:hypothetical protein
MSERFTRQAREAIAYAEWAARSGPRDDLRPRARRAVEPVHLLLGLLLAEGSAAHEVLAGRGVTAAEVLLARVARRADEQRAWADRYEFTAAEAGALRTLGIDLIAVLSRAEASLGPGAFSTPPPADRGPRPSRARLSRAARAVLAVAAAESRWLRAGSIGSEHLLLGLMRADDAEVRVTLHALGVEPDAVVAATLRTIGRSA